MTAHSQALTLFDCGDYLVAVGKMPFVMHDAPTGAIRSIFENP